MYVFRAFAEIRLVRISPLAVARVNQIFAVGLAAVTPTADRGFSATRDSAEIRLVRAKPAVPAPVRLHPHLQHLPFPSPEQTGRQLSEQGLEYL